MAAGNGARSMGCATCKTWLSFQRRSAWLMVVIDPPPMADQIAYRHTKRMLHRQNGDRYTLKDFGSTTK
jgi:hypothetical protein